MSEVRVTDVTMKFDASTAGYQLAVVMVPGTIPGPREIDAGHLHPAVREHLASWAGDDRLMGDLLAELRVLRTQAVLTESKPAEIAAALGDLIERYTK